MWRDSFSFAESGRYFTVSFEIKSLFTKITLEEQCNICVDLEDWGSTFPTASFAKICEQFSSNINEVDSFKLFIIFLRKDFTCKKEHKIAQKSTKSTKNTKKHKSATKQKHKNAKKRTKIKNALKNI